MGLDRGVIYVATQGLRFLCEAMASADSVRRLLPDLSLTLFTDLVEPDRPLAPFDIVRTFELPPLPSVSPWARGLYARVATMRCSPYRRTVSLDTDTRVLRPEFARIFDELEHHSFAAVPCTPERSCSCQWFGPMFNGGLIAFRRDPCTERLLGDWDALHRRHLAWMAADDCSQVPDLAHLGAERRQFYLGTNQPSLARLVAPGRPNAYGMSVKELPEVFNAHGFRRAELHDGVIVDHHDRHKVADDRVSAFLEARGLSYLEDTPAGRPEPVIVRPGVVCDRWIAEEYR